MRRVFINCIIGLSGILCLASCGSTKKYNEAKTVDIKTEVIQYPTLVDLKVDPVKITTTIVCDYDKRGLQIIKDNALAQAAKGVGADVIVEPMYELVFKGKKVKVTLTGFPARYVNFRNATQEDILLLDVFRRHDCKVVDAKKTTTPMMLLKKKGKNKSK